MSKVLQSTAAYVHSVCSLTGAYNGLKIRVRVKLQIQDIQYELGVWANGFRVKTELALVLTKQS